MAIQKPFSISLTGVTIDGAENNIITWKVSGATQTSFSISILNNTTLVSAFSLVQTTSSISSYTLPALSLTNGIEYKIAITVWDAGANTATSDYVVFQTSSRPVVTVDTIGTVSNQSNNFTATYTQSESVAIKSWISYLYNSSEVKINQSVLQSATPIEHIYNNLLTGNTYYVEFQATSNKGLIGTSGLISFSVSYSSPTFNTGLVLTNTENAGINVSWEARQILGISENSTFIDDEKLDTTSGRVYFNNGFTIDDDFTLKSWFESVSDVEISEDPELIWHDTSPTNINSVWLDDATKGVEAVTDIVIKSTAPADTTLLWIQDVGFGVETPIDLYIDESTPLTTSYLWADTIAPDGRLNQIMILQGDEGELTIEYYNGSFHLVFYNLIDERSVIDSVVASGSVFYVYVQQISGVFTISVEVIS
jgi:hypothetical protein